MSPSNHLPPADPVGSVFADAPSGMFITSPRGRILHVNPAFLRSGVHAPDLYTRLRQSLRETGVWRGQMGAAARRHGRQVVVCYLDIDGFKGINDSLGHHAGDRVLVEVARRLGREIRSGDTVARLRGDEFVLLFAEPGAMADIQAVLDRILDSLSRAQVEPGPVGISVSVGVTLFPMDDGCPDTLLRHADTAMYQAKRSGRSAYCFFHPLGGGTPDFSPAGSHLDFPICN